MGECRNMQQANGAVWNLESNEIQLHLLNLAHGGEGDRESRGRRRGRGRGLSPTSRAAHFKENRSVRKEWSRFEILDSGEGTGRGSVGRCRIPAEPIPAKPHFISISPYSYLQFVYVSTSSSTMPCLISPAETSNKNAAILRWLGLHTQRLTNTCTQPHSSSICLFAPN